MSDRNEQRDRELARIREDIRRTTREIVRLAKQEMQKARNRVQQRKEEPERTTS